MVKSLEFQLLRINQIFFLPYEESQLNRRRKYYSNVFYRIQIVLK